MSFPEDFLSEIDIANEAFHRREARPLICSPRHRSYFQYITVSRHTRFMRRLSARGCHLGEQVAQESARVRLLDAGDLLGRAGGHDLASTIAALGAEVEEMVG